MNPNRVLFWAFVAAVSIWPRSPFSVSFRLHAEQTDPIVLRQGQGANPLPPEWSNGPEILTDGGWQTEKIANQAKHLLEQLWQISAIDGTRSVPATSARSHELTDHQLAEILAEDFRANDIQHVRDTVVFQDNGLLIRRGNAGPILVNAGQAGQTSASARWREWAHQLAKPFDGLDDVQVHFKLFKVDVSGNRASTQAYYQAAGRRRVANDEQSRLLQQNAVWIAKWHLRENGSQLKLAELELLDYEEVESKAETSPLFADCTQAVLGRNKCYVDQLLPGIDHWRRRILAEFGMGISGFEGVAIGDVDGDGLDDIYVCQPGGLPNRLFIHKPDGSALDASAVAGVDFLDQTNSVLLADFDNDGDQDLFLGMAQSLVLMANDGRAHFTTSWQKSIREIPFSLAGADYDQDGKLDVYVCVYASGGTLFDGGSAAPMPWYDANNGGANFLLRNTGKLGFDDATESSGMNVNNRRFSYAACWEDYDNDGDQDLYVANDFGRNNLYRNDSGKFVDVARECKVEDSSAGMSADWGDFNRDGRMDLYVGNMFSSAGNRISYQRSFRSELTETERAEIQRHARGNSLFANQPDGSFLDVTLETRSGMGRWAWCSRFWDWNNDGWQDLYVANGFVTQAADSDL